MCAVIIALSASAQQKIDGIGKLRLGAPVELIDELGLGTPKLVGSDLDFYKMERSSYIEPKSIYEMTPPGEEKRYGEQWPKVQDERVFYISEYEIVSGVVLKKVQLHFYKNALYSIVAESNRNFEELLTLKYGKPKLEVKTEDKKYTNTFTGATITKTDEHYFSEWATNDEDIKCFSMLLKMHNRKGESNISYTFTLERSDIKYDIGAEARQREQSAKDEELNKKKQLLEDF